MTVSSDQALCDLETLRVRGVHGSNDATVDRLRAELGRLADVEERLRVAQEALHHLGHQLYETRCAGCGGPVFYVSMFEPFAGLEVRCGSCGGETASEPEGDEENVTRAPLAPGGAVRPDRLSAGSGLGVNVPEPRPVFSGSLAASRADTAEPDDSTRIYTSVPNAADVRFMRADTAEPRPEGREGMVTVYDHEDRYLGCMGREMWERLLADNAEPRCTCYGDALVADAHDWRDPACPVHGDAR